MKSLLSILLGITAVVTSLSVPAAEFTRSTAAKVDSEARADLNALTAKIPLAKSLAPKAAAILVFPSITKAGLIVGGQYGRGALIKGGKTVAYYSIGGASAGLQAGAQKYSFALFFMKQDALKQIDKADGFEIGVGPTVVAVDEGAGKQATTTTTQADIYSFVFGQKGLMAGIDLRATRSPRSPRSSKQRKREYDCGVSAKR